MYNVSNADSKRCQDLGIDKFVCQQEDALGCNPKDTWTPTSRGRHDWVRITSVPRRNDLEIDVLRQQVTIVSLVPFMIVVSGTAEAVSEQ